MNAHRTHRKWPWLILLLPVLLLLAVWLWQWFSNPGAELKAPPPADPQAQRVRGEYLARAGNCMACHTARGGAALAGGRVIATPFGNLVSPNITPDAQSGIGNWSADDFWRAMHNGRGRDGRFLYPAFPYPNYTRVTREDSDAIFAWLQSLPPVQRENQPHALRFPYNQRPLLAFWRALYFRPGVWQDVAGQDAQLNRGAYLVQGLGHCNACHASRDVLGGVALTGELSGGMIPMLNWYAPALSGRAEGLLNWEAASLHDLLKTGVSAQGAVFGPMSEVVRSSLQHLRDEDIAAMVAYMKSLPPTEPAQVRRGRIRAEDVETATRLGAQLYEKHCVDCHRADGRGQPPDYPPLVGNGSVMTPSAVNAIRIVLNGGFPPSTQGNPRPAGMPPFGPFLSDAEVAAVVTYIRTAWGNKGGMVGEGEVASFRSVPID